MQFFRYVKRVVVTIFYLAILLVPAIFLQYFSDSELFHAIELYVENYWWLYTVSIISVKAISIVYPPLPGVAASISAIPFIGWQQAYILDLIGSIFGASISYFLGKKYGISLLRKVVGEGITQKLVDLKLKDRNQLEAVIVLRIAAGGMLSDGLAWGASVVGFSYRSYITGHTISHILTTVPVFYLIAVSSSVRSWIGLAFAAVVAWGLIFVFKGRYFE